MSVPVRSPTTAFRLAAGPIPSACACALYAAIQGVLLWLEPATAIADPQLILLWLGPSLCAGSLYALLESSATDSPRLRAGLARVSIYGREIGTCGVAFGFPLEIMTALAPLPLATLCYHGFVQSSSIRHIAGPTASFFAILAAAFVEPRSVSVPILSIMLPVGVGGRLLFGAISEAERDERNRRSALRAAVRAQILEERTRDLQSLSSTIDDIMERNREASNALSTALLGAELMVRQIRQLSSRDRKTSEIIQMVRDTETSLRRLKRFIDDARRLGRTGADVVPALAPVRLFDAIDSALVQVRSRYRSTRLERRFDVRDRTNPLVAVRGGEEVLHRILDNLLVNACQGDGRRAATKVEVVVAPPTLTGSVRMQVIDDGPGFSPAQLANAISGFETTKPDGTGLGLYTCERLIHASGGSLTRENRPSGGASLTVFLNTFPTPAVAALTAQPAQSAGADSEPTRIHKY